MHCCKRRIPRKQILFFKIGVVTTFFPQVIIYTSMILLTHMSFDCANTMYSAYFGITYGLFDSALSLSKYLIELEISKSTHTSILANY